MMPVVNTRHKRRPMAEINVVPYIDVMLVLLIIFMITTPLLSQGVQVNLPQAKARTLSPEKQEPIIISVDQKGQLFLNINEDPDQVLSPDRVALRVAAEMKLATQAQQKRLVLVKGDKRVDYGAVVQTMALLQQAGVDNVGLMTDGQSSVKPLKAG